MNETRRIPNSGLDRTFHFSKIPSEVTDLINRNIGAAIYGGGIVLEILCVMGYMIDTYQKYAASAMAAIIVLRSILAFALPLVAPSL